MGRKLGGKNTIPKSPSNSPYELAWAAGFFDGEGSIYLNHHKAQVRKSGKIQSEYISVDLNIHQVRVEPLIRFCNAVGLGVVNGPYKPKTENSNEYYMWTTGGRHNVYEVMLSLWPYLSLPKKEQSVRCWNTLMNSRESKKVSKIPFKELPPL